MKHILINCIILFLFFQIISCSDKWVEPTPPTPSISILDDKIVCENCGGFGSIIEVDGNEVVVSGVFRAYIFQWQNQILELKQTLNDFPNGIRSILFKNGNLIIGSFDDGGDVVYIYEKGNNDWEKIQELKVGRSGDGFGSAIDISEDFLIIGASAPSRGFGYTDVKEGRIYIYKKSGSEWTLEKEFKSENSSAGDSFGESIAIQGDYILAGSWGVPLHIYHFDGEWKFLRTEPIYTSKIVHHENNFLARNEESYENMLYAFTLDDNSNFNYSDVSFDFSNHELSGHGEILDMYETQSIFALEMENYCFTMEYLNNQWTNIAKTEPEENQTTVMLGIEITEDKIYMVGEDNVDDWKSYVYILDY